MQVRVQYRKGLETNIFGFNKVAGEVLGLAAHRNVMGRKLAQCWASQAEHYWSMLATQRTVRASAFDRFATK
jgi:hypothetical protein